MLHNQEFAIEQLETRLEQFCIYIPYVGNLLQARFGS